MNLKIRKKIAMCIVCSLCSTNIQAIPIANKEKGESYQQQIQKDVSLVTTAQGIDIEKQVTTPSMFDIVQEGEIKFRTQGIYWPMVLEVQYKEYYGKDNYRYDSPNFRSDYQTNQLSEGYELVFNNVNWSLADTFYISIQVENMIYDLQVTKEMATQVINLEDYAVHPLVWDGLTQQSMKIRKLNFISQIDENGVERRVGDAEYNSYYDYPLSITGGRYTATINIAEEEEYYIFCASINNGLIIKPTSELERITIHNGNPLESSINTISFWSNELPYANIPDAKKEYTIYTNKSEWINLYIYLQNESDPNRHSYGINQVIDISSQPYDLWVDTNFSSQINLKSMVLNAGGTLILNQKGSYNEINNYEIIDSYNNLISIPYNYEGVGTLSLSKEGQVISTARVDAYGKMGVELPIPEEAGVYTLNLDFNEELGIKGTSIEVTVTDQVIVPDNNIGFVIHNDQVPQYISVKYKDYWDDENYTYITEINKYYPQVEIVGKGYLWTLSEQLDWDRADTYYVDIQAGNQIYTAEITQDQLGQVLDLTKQVRYQLSTFPFQAEEGVIDNIRLEKLDEKGITQYWFSIQQPDAPVCLPAGEYSATITARDNTYYYAVTTMIVDGELQLTTEDMEKINITHVSTYGDDYINRITIDSLKDKISGRRRYISVDIDQFNEVILYTNKSSDVKIASLISFSEDNKYGGYELENQVDLNNGPVNKQTDLNFTSKLLLPETLKLTDNYRYFYLRNQTEIKDSYGNQLIEIQGFPDFEGKLIFEQDGQVICENQLNYGSIYNYAIPNAEGVYTAKLEFNTELKIPTCTQEVQVKSREAIGANDIGIFIPTDKDVSIQQVAWKYYRGETEQPYSYNLTWLENEIYPVEGGVQVIIRNISFWQNLLKISFKSENQLFVVELTEDMKGSTTEVSPIQATMPINTHIEYLGAEGNIQSLSLYQLDADNAGFYMGTMRQDESIQVPEGNYLVRVTAKDSTGKYDLYVRTDNGQIIINQDQLRTLHLINNDLKSSMNIESVHISPKNKILYPIESIIYGSDASKTLSEQYTLYTNIMDDVDVYLQIADMKKTYHYQLMIPVSGNSLENATNIFYDFNFSSELKLNRDKVASGDQLAIRLGSELIIKDTYGNSLNWIKTYGSLGKITLSKDEEVIKEEVVEYYDSMLFIQVPEIEGIYELGIEFDNVLNIPAAHTSINVTQNRINEYEIGFIIPEQSITQGNYKVQIRRKTSKNSNRDYYYEGISYKWRIENTSKGKVAVITLENLNPGDEYAGGITVDGTIYDISFSYKDMGQELQLIQPQNTYDLVVDLPYFAEGGKIQNIIVNKVDEQNKAFEVSYSSGEALRIPEGRYVVQINAQDNEGYYIIYKPLVQGVAQITQEDLQYMVIEDTDVEEDICFNYLHAVANTMNEYELDATWKLLLLSNSKQIKVYTNKSDSAEFIIGLEDVQSHDRYETRLTNISLVDQPVYKQFDTHFIADIQLDKNTFRVGEEIKIRKNRELNIRDSYGNPLTWMRSNSNNLGNIIIKNATGEVQSMEMGKFLSNYYFNAPKEEGVYTLVLDFDEQIKIEDTSIEIQVTNQIGENQIGFMIPTEGNVTSYNIVYKKSYGDNYWYGSDNAEVGISNDNGKTQVILYNVNWEYAQYMYFNITIDGKLYSIPFESKDKGQMLEVSKQEVYQDLVLNLPYVAQGGEILAIGINRMDENGKYYDMGYIAYPKNIKLPQGNYVIQVIGELNKEYYITYTSTSDGVVSVSEQELGLVSIQNTDMDSDKNISNVFLIPSQADYIPLSGFYGLGRDLNTKEVNIYTNKVNDLRVLTHLVDRTKGVRYEVTGERQWGSGILTQSINTAFNTQLQLDVKGIAPGDEITVENRRELVIQDSYENIVGWITRLSNRSKLEALDNVYNPQENNENVVSRMLEKAICQVSFIENDIEQEALMLEDYPTIKVQAPQKSGKYIMKIEFADDLVIPEVEKEIFIVGVDLENILTQGIYEENAKGLIYKGDWIDTLVPNSSQGHVQASETKGNRLSFRFEGNGFVWKTISNDWRGKARVKVDGMEVGIVDQYSPTAELKESIRVEGLVYGVHEVEIEVLGEKHVNSYSTKVTVDTIEILNKKSSNANLATLEVNQGILTPNFSPEEQKYTVEVEYTTQEIILTAQAGDEKAQIDGIGSKVLEVGENHFEITVTAEDQTQKVYSVVVVRKAPEALTEGIYEENAKGLIYKGNWIDTLVTNSSQGHVQASETKGNRLSFRFEGNGFVWKAVNNSWRGKARVKVDGVEVGIVDQYSLTAELKESIRVEGLVYGVHEVEIEVLGEKHVNSQATKVTVDTIEILNKKSGNANLANLEVNQGTLTPNFSPGEQKYTVEVGYTTQEIVLSAQAEDEKAQIDGIGSKVLEVGENHFEITVTAEDQTQKVYSIVVVRKSIVLRAGVYEETSQGLSYKGTWGSFEKDIVSGGKVAFSEEKGATLEFIMEGTEFIWFGHVNAWRGKAKVYVDDMEVGVVDQYIYPGQGVGNIAAEYIGIFKVTGLSPTQHKVKIEILDEKAINSQASKVTVDKFIIRE